MSQLSLSLDLAPHPSLPLYSLLIYRVRHYISISISSSESRKSGRALLLMACEDRLTVASPRAVESTFGDSTKQRAINLLDIAIH